MIQSHQRNLKAMFAGLKIHDFSLTMTPQNLAFYNVVFPGYLIAHMGWGLVVFFLTVWLTLFIIYILVLAIISSHQVLLYAVIFLKFVCLYFTVPVLTYIIQLLLVRFVFCERETKELGMLRNVGVYNTTIYFFLFYNVIVGITSCIVRSIKGLFISLIFLGRIDRSPFAFFKSRDYGHCAYIGFLRLQSLYKNPVMRCFVQILMEAVDSTTLHSAENIGGIDVNSGNYRMSSAAMFPNSVPVVNKTARNRWFLAYTLIRNPTLLQERHGTLRVNGSGGGDLDADSTSGGCNDLTLSTNRGLLMDPIVDRSEQAP